VGTPPANTGKCAKAALNTTLAQALIAPKTKNHRADKGQTSGKASEAWAKDGLDMGLGHKAKNGTRALEHVYAPHEHQEMNDHISGLR
jgi:hypothetical protein